MLNDVLMQQLKLFMCDNVSCKTVNIESIAAAFRRVWDSTYEVILEINSNKFLILFQTTMNKIEQFEVLAVKWFVSVSKNILKTLKRIVYKLYFEY